MNIDLVIKLFSISEEDFQKGDNIWLAVVSLIFNRKSKGQQFPIEIDTIHWM